MIYTLYIIHNTKKNLLSFKKLKILKMISRNIIFFKNSKILDIGNRKTVLAEFVS